MSQTIAGGVSNVLAEVDANTRALHANLRGHDVGALGSYSVCVKSGVEAAGASANSPILAFKWTPLVNTTGLALIKRIKFQAWNLGTGFTAGNFVFDFFVARSFTIQDTGGAAVTLTTNNGKLRTSHATTQATIQAASTGVLTAGTRTKDANPFRTLAGVVANAAFAALLPEQTEVFRQQPGEWPLVFAPNEGFVIEATVPATGTWTWGCDIDWDEVAAY